MKKTLIALTLVLLSVGIFAAQRSVNEAAAIAAQVNNHAWHKISKQFVSAAPQEAPSVRLVRTQNQPLSDKAAFYVFDREDQGFVIVSADDNTRDILAYSNQGSFPKQVPANVQFLLDYMAERIAYTSQIGKAVDATSFYTPVTPLLDGIQWNQGKPYRDKCPIDKNGNQTVTGCVATATAQVMRYWKWPTKGTGSHSYTIDNVDGILSANFGATTYDWANMPKTTSGYTTSEQKDAVATLMYHIGVAVEMNYSSSGSGAHDSDVATALVNYFGYKNTLEFVNTYRSGKLWESSYKTARRMREDLAKGHPIIVGGSDASSGHAFVFEGYDENGLFYVNWGWGGSYNGYYAIDYLEPRRSGTGGNGAGYSNYLNYIIGIEPNGSVTPPTPSTPETISGLQNGEAGYRAHDGSPVWYIDLYKGYNNDHIYPELEFSINAKSKTSLSGTYNLLDVKYTTTTRKVIQCNNGRVTISLAQTGKYNIEGTFYGDDGKTYTFDQAIAISACDLDNNRAEITLVEPTEPIVKTCTEAAAIALALPENNVPTVEVYSITGYVTNVVSDVSNGQQTFWMDDENGIKKTFEGYGCNLPAKDQKTLNVGDLVKIVGPIMKDNATPEMKNGDITIIDRVDAPRDTLYFSYLGIDIYECTNWETGVQTGWLYNLVDASTGYEFLLESTVVDEKYGTFSYADKTLGRNYINIYSPDNNLLQFVEGSITVSDVGDSIVLDGELIAEDEKVYVLHFVQPVDVLDYDSKVPLDATFAYSDMTAFINSGVISIRATNAEELTIELELYTNPTNTTIPAGTYVISDTKEAGTALQSHGLVDGYMTRCWTCVKSRFGIDSCWFIVEGTVTLGYDKKDLLKVEVNGKNSFGQSVKAKINVPAVPTNIPTIQDLSAAGYDVINKRVICLKFDEQVCNPIVWTGTYNDEVINPTDMLHFQALEGFDDWYVIELNDYSNPVKGKPVQLKEDGSFSWDFQSGDVDAWINMAQPNTKTATITPSYAGEAECTWPELGVYIYELAYFKNHNTPCSGKPKHNYSITAYLPEFCEEIAAYADSVCVMGDFDNWTDGIRMEKKVDGEFNTYYYAELNNVEEGTEFTLRCGTMNWDIQPQLNGQDLDDKILGKTTDIVLQYDGEGYGFAACTSLKVGDTFVINGVTYMISSIGSNNTVKVYQYDGVSSSLSLFIPESVWYKDYRFVVTEIYQRSFANRTNLKSISLPNTLVTIEEEAFYGCTGLTSLTIPYSVTMIGREAFAGSRLTYFYVAWTSSNQLPTMGVDVFNGIANQVGPSDAALHVPSGTKSIYETADQWKDFGEIIEVELKVGDKFENNGLWYQILTVGKTNTVKIIGHTNYKNLQTANIPNSISHAGTIFDVVEIEDMAFHSCKDLTSVTIGNSVTTIGVLAFYECVGLTSVTIGNSVTEIGSLAFAFCENLTSIVIPNSVTTIGEYAFEGCFGLTSLTIGSSVATIGERAFLACNVLTSIICYAVTPPECGDDVFGYISQDAKVYVPASALTDYQSAKVWKDMLLLPIAADVAPIDNENPVVTPTDQEVTITWAITDGADTYTLTISQNGKTVCVLTFNAQGQLTHITFAAPGHNGARQAPAATLTAQGYQFTVTGLDPGTSYEYSVTATNAGGQTLAEHKGNFSTTGGGTPTSVDEVHGSQCTMHKYFHNGNLIIERNGVKYTPAGQKVR